MRFRLGSLLIVLALGPPVLGGGVWLWLERQRRQEVIRVWAQWALENMQRASPYLDESGNLVDHEGNPIKVDSQPTPLDRP